MGQNLKVLLGAVGFIALLVIALIAYNTLSKQVTTDNSSDVDRKIAPDFSMTDSDGNTVKLSDMKGKPIVLNFWASWCSPCKIEMPDFEKAYKEFGDEIQFIMLNLTDGMRETKDIGAKYVREQGYTFPVFFDNKQEGASAYAVRSIPITLFIDKDGYIIAETQGTIDENTLRKGIDLIK